jgi:hypothetical protein
MAVPPPCGVRVTVIVVMISSSFTGSGLLSSPEQDVTNKLKKLIENKKLIVFIMVRD